MRNLTELLTQINTLPNLSNNESVAILDKSTNTLYEIQGIKEDMVLEGAVPWPYVLITIKSIKKGK